MLFDDAVHSVQFVRTHNRQLHSQRGGRDQLTVLDDPLRWTPWEARATQPEGQGPWLVLLPRTYASTTGYELERTILAL